MFEGINPNFMFNIVAYYKEMFGNVSTTFHTNICHNLKHMKFTLIVY